MDKKKLDTTGYLIFKIGVGLLVIVLIFISYYIFQAFENLFFFLRCRIQRRKVQIIDHYALNLVPSVCRRSVFESPLMTSPHQWLWIIMAEHTVRKRYLFECFHD